MLLVSNSIIQKVTSSMSFTMTNRLIDNLFKFDLKNYRYADFFWRNKFECPFKADDLTVEISVAVTALGRFLPSD